MIKLYAIAESFWHLTTKPTDQGSADLFRVNVDERQGHGIYILEASEVDGQASTNAVEWAGCIIDGADAQKKIVACKAVSMSMRHDVVLSPVKCIENTLLDEWREGGAEKNFGRI